MRKKCLLPLVLFGVIFMFSLVLVEDWSLRFFFAVFGNEVPAVSFTYRASPIYIQGQTSLRFDFEFNITQVKAPIETIRFKKYQIEEYENPYVDVSDRNFALSLTTKIYADAPDNIDTLVHKKTQNRKTVFQHTYSFMDANTRTITMYLADLINNNFFTVLFIEVSGSFELDGQSVPISAGEMFILES